MKASNRIPKELREQVTNVVMHMKRTPSPAKKYSDWIIEVYNAYYTPSPLKKESCRTDRINVLNTLYANVQIWKKQEEQTL
jgi:hypothetical protein